MGAHGASWPPTHGLEYVPSVACTASRLIESSYVLSIHWYAFQSPLGYLIILLSLSFTSPPTVMESQFAALSPVISQLPLWLRTGHSGLDCNCYDMMNCPLREQDKGRERSCNADASTCRIAPSPGSCVVELSSAKRTCFPLAMRLLTLS